MDDTEFINVLKMQHRIKLFTYKGYVSGFIRLFNDKIFITVYDEGEIKVNSKNYLYIGNVDYGDKALQAITIIKHNILYYNITALLIWVLFTLAISSLLIKFI